MQVAAGQKATAGSVYFTWKLLPAHYLDVFSWSEQCNREAALHRWRHDINNSTADHSACPHLVFHRQKWREYSDHGFKEK